MQPKQPSSKSPWVSVLAATFVMQFTNAYLYFLCPILAPAVLEASRQSAWFIGWLGVLSTLGSIVFMLWGNALIARWGPLRSLQIGTLIGGASTLLLLVPGPIGISLANLLMGLGYGPSAPAGSDILQRFAPTAHRNLIFSIRQAGVPLSGILAGLSLPYLYAAGGWTSVVSTTIIFSTLAVIAVNLVRAVTDGNAVPIIHIVPPLVPTQTFQAPFRVLLDNRLLSLALAGSCLAVGHGCWVAYFVSWLIYEAKMSLLDAGGMFAIMQVASVVGRLALGWLADRSRADLVMLGLAIVGSAMMSLTLTWAPVSTSREALTMVAIGAGVAVSGWNGVQLAAVTRRARAADVASCASGATIVVFLGFIFGPAAFAGLLIIFDSLALCFAAVAITTLAGLFFVARTILRDQSYS